MTTQASTTDMASGYEDMAWRVPIKIGSTVLENSSGSIQQFLELSALVPEQLTDESFVKVQASFGVQIPASTVLAGDMIESWASFS